LGDEFSVRYVPQSTYFQAQELSVERVFLGADEFTELQREGRFMRWTGVLRSERGGDAPR